MGMILTLLRKNKRVTSQKESLNADADGEQRYREYGIFQYWFPV